MNEEELLELPDEAIATEELEDQDLTPDEAAASLAFSNLISENTILPELAQMGGGEAPEDAETAPQGEEIQETPQQQTEEPQEAPQEADIEALVDEKVEEKIGELRDQITSALEEDDTEEEE